MEQPHKSTTDEIPESSIMTSVEMHCSKQSNQPDEIGKLQQPHQLTTPKTITLAMYLKQNVQTPTPDTSSKTTPAVEMHSDQTPTPDSSKVTAVDGKGKRKRQTDEERRASKLRSARIQSEKK